MKHISSTAHTFMVTSVSLDFTPTTAQTVCGLWVDISDIAQIGTPWEPSRVADVIDCQPCLFGNAIKSELGAVARSVESLTEEVRGLVHRDDVSNQVTVAGQRKTWFR